MLYDIDKQKKIEHVPYEEDFKKFIKKIETMKK